MTRAITMWDFSWLEHPRYADWNLVLDELVARGYDTVRIDAYPHLIAYGADRGWRLLPVWDQHDWGATTPITVRLRPALTEFVAACRDKGVAVALSSWFRRDTDDVRMRIRSPEEHGRVWIATLAELDRAGLLDAIWYVDLCNEFPLRIWAPFVYESPGEGDRLRHDPFLMDWMARSIATVREAYPTLSYCYSVAEGVGALDREDPAPVDLYEPHIWMAHPDISDFYRRIGYDLAASQFDPRQYAILAERAEATYRADPEHWQRLLTHAIHRIAEVARSHRRPLVTTECWSIVNYKDLPGLDWGWVKELCALGVREAAATGCWAAISTSNFSGPQFSLWDDIDWHRGLNEQIRLAPGCMDDRSASRLR